VKQSTVILLPFSVPFAGLKRTRSFIAAIESYWEEMDLLTTAHRRSQVGPKVYDIKTGLAV